ncbi:hypothetical protein AB4Z54_47140, partial [Streptomyces sp. MCAF7]
MLEVLNLHPVAWRTELFALLTEQAEFRCSWAVDFIEHLALDTGRAVPTTDGFLEGWLSSRSPGKRRAPCLRGGPQPGATLLERLRADYLSPKLLPLVMERPKVSLHVYGLFGEMTGYDRPKADTRLGAFINLCAEGLVDRAALIRCVFAELVDLVDLDGYRTSGQAAAFALTELALTPAERASVASERAALAESLRGAPTVKVAEVPVTDKKATVDGEQITVDGQTLKAIVLSNSTG